MTNFIRTTLIASGIVLGLGAFASAQADSMSSGFGAGSAPNLMLPQGAGPVGSTCPTYHQIVNKQGVVIGQALDDSCK